MAVFVDAGYLFAQGGLALSGTPGPRSRLVLDEKAVVEALKAIASRKGQDSRLLRIYWYDGAAGGRLSTDQSALANSDDVKLRLGQINSLGQQKGVDSLIVTDLIELARNRALSDALLLSGDEDVRIGVQIAQSFGVRVHLVGIEAQRKSQSPLLMQEADTRSMWTKAEVEKFLSLRVDAEQHTSPLRSTAPSLESVAEEWAEALDDGQVKSFADYRKSNNSVPPDLDGKLLGRARDALGRDLEQKEKKTLRARFVEAVKKRQPALFSK